MLFIRIYFYFITPCLAPSCWAVLTSSSRHRAVHRGTRLTCSVFVSVWDLSPCVSRCQTSESIILLISLISVHMSSAHKESKTCGKCNYAMRNSSGSLWGKSSLQTSTNHKTTININILMHLFSHLGSLLSRERDGQGSKEETGGMQRPKGQENDCQLNKFCLC